MQLCLPLLDASRDPKERGQAATPTATRAGSPAQTHPERSQRATQAQTTGQLEINSAQQEHFE